jgi:hypothetical protein
MPFTWLVPSLKGGLMQGNISARCLSCGSTVSLRDYLTGMLCPVCGDGTLTLQEVEPMPLETAITDSSWCPMHHLPTHPAIHTCRECCCNTDLAGLPTCTFPKIGVKQVSLVTLTAKHQSQEEKLK